MKKMILLLMLFTFLLMKKSEAQNKWISARADGHAPIGVTFDHYHAKGEWMFSYQFMYMRMEDNLSSTDDIGINDIFRDFSVAPQKMNTQMHMAGVMYAPVNAVTLSFMATYLIKDMDLTSRQRMDFNTSSEGFGDLSFAALIKIFNRAGQTLHADLGISIPTGGLDQRDDTPVAADSKLAYPMQLGSGTWDPFAGLTYLGQISFLSWGLQGIYLHHVDENNRNYTIGDVLKANVWLALRPFNFVSLSVRGAYTRAEKITGSDNDWPPDVMPLFDSDNSGRDQADVAAGLNFYIPAGAFKNLRLGVELVNPVYQDVNGIQMKALRSGIVGIQYSFGGHHE